MDSLYILSTEKRTSGASLTAPYALSNQSNCAPSLAVFKGQIHMAFTGTDHRLNICTLGADGLFGSQVICKDTSDCGPSLTSFTDDKNQEILYMAFTGQNKNVYICSSKNSTYANKFSSGNTSNYAPSLTTFGGRLYLAFTGENGHLYIRGSLDGETFYNQMDLHTTSKAGPSLAVFKSRLYMAFIGEDGRINLWSSPNGNNFFNQIQLPEMMKSNEAPTIATFGDYLYLAFTGTDKRLHICSSRDGAAFSNYVSLLKTSGVGSGLAALENFLYWSFTESDGDLTVGDSHHLILDSFKSVLEESSNEVTAIINAMKNDDHETAKKLMAELMLMPTFASLLGIVKEAGFKAIGLVGSAEAGLVIGASGSIGLLTGVPNSKEAGKFYECLEGGLSIGLTEGADAALGLFVSTADPSDCHGMDVCGEVAGDFGVGVAIQTSISPLPGGSAAFTILVTTGEEISVSVGLIRSTVRQI